MNTDFCGFRGVQKRFGLAVPFVVAFVLILVRLALTGDRDIVAINSPHDEYWYVERALKGVFGGGYDQMAIMHLPIYAWWLEFLSFIGIPARLGIELAWVVSCGYLAYAVKGLTGRVWISIVLLAFLVLHPYTLVVFDRALAETLLTVISALAIGGGIEIWNTKGSLSCRRRVFAGAVFALSVALAYHLRKEGVVLLVPIGLLVLLSWVRRESWWSHHGVRRLVLPLIGAPLIATLVVGFCLASANAVRWSIFARYDLAASGYTRAIGALNAIDLGRTPRQITVTKAMLESAYRESPTFAQLKPYMEGGVGKNWVAIAAPFTAEPGEIGNGWFYWALRDVAAAAGWHKTAADADHHYAAVADELELAFSTGRLKRRGGVFSSFVDPDIAKWINEVPAAAIRVGAMLVRTPPGALTAPPESASAEQFDNYQRLAGRRQPPARVTVGGWAIVPPGSFVGLKKDGVFVGLAPVGLVPRADVPGGYPFEIKVSGLTPPYSIVLRDSGGLEGGAVDGLLGVGKIVPLEGALKGTIGIDKLVVGTPSKRIDNSIQTMIHAYEWIGYCGLIVIGIGLGYATISGYAGGAVLAVSILLLALIAVRVFLFAVLDASSWSGLQVRYILPVVPAFGVIVALAGAVLINLLPRKDIAK